jgi:thioredoxin-disulfide reductase
MIYDLIIIGADAAGLSAGIYAGRKKLNTIILTKKLGGQSLLTDNIENYPGFLEISGVELVSKMKKQVEKFGVPIKEGEEVLEIRFHTASAVNRISFVVKTKEKEHRAKSDLVATGMRRRPLNVPVENEFMGKGVSVCTICDAPFFVGKDVAVIGGGNSAFESAYDLLKYADKIYLLQHNDKFKADKALYERVKQSNRVEFLTNAEIQEIKGLKMVEEMVYEDIKSGQTKKLKVSGVFINIGQIPNSSFVENFLELNEYKEIVIDLKTNASSVPGVFAAGDVTEVKYKQSIVAAAEGVKAALSAFEYLRNL